MNVNSGTEDRNFAMTVLACEWMRYQNKIGLLGRLLRLYIVHFHLACLGTKIFLRALTLSSTPSLNPKGSRSVDAQFSHKLLFYLH